jgi:hypothetical protein
VANTRAITLCLTDIQVAKAGSGTSNQIGVGFCCQRFRSRRRFALGWPRQLCVPYKELASRMILYHSSVFATSTITRCRCMLEAVSLSEIREFDIIFRDQNFNIRKVLSLFVPSGLTPGYQPVLTCVKDSVTSCGFYTDSHGFLGPPQPRYTSNMHG